MYDCIVVGGGIIGTMTALELRKSGAEVLLLERGEIGKESSWAGGGILSPIYPWNYPHFMQEFAFWCQKEYPKLAREVEQKTGIDPECIQSGMLLLDEEEFENAFTFGHSHEIPFTIMGKEKLKKDYPEINHNRFDSGILFPQTYQVRNPRLLKALEKMLELSGVETKTNSPVEKVVVENKRVTKVQCSGENTFLCKNLILACGAWTNKVLKGIHTLRNLRPIRGQILLFQARSNLISPIICAGGHYMIPRKDGRILIGSTIEDVGFDKSPTSGGYDELKNAAVELIPELKNDKIEHHWAGLRPGSENGVPTISQVPDCKGLFINTGHFRNGLLLAPGSARLLSDLVQGRKSIVDPEPFQFQ